MNMQVGRLKAVRWALICMAALIVGVAAPEKSVQAEDGCSCVEYVVDQLYNGVKKGGPEEYRSDPVHMAMKSDNSFARTGETSVYWSWNDDGLHPPRYNAGRAKAGDVVIFIPGDPLYIWQNKQMVPTGVESTGHVGIVQSAQYRGPTRDPWTHKGGWEIVITHANWNGCGVLRSRFFIPNGTSTSWWREY